MFNFLDIPVAFSGTGSLNRQSPNYEYRVESILNESFEVLGSAWRVNDNFDLPIPIIIPAEGRIINLDPTRYRKVYTHMRDKPRKD